MPCAAVEVAAVGLCGLSLVYTYEHKVVRGEVSRVFEPYGSEEAPIRAQDVVATGAVAKAQACLGPGVFLAVAPSLGEVREEVFEAVGGEDVCDLVCLRGGVVGEVNIEVPK